MTTPESAEPVVITRDGLDRLVEALIAGGYRVIGPTVRDSAIVLGELDSAGALPAGWGVDTGPGYYRLRRRADAAVFAHSAGPGSGSSSCTCRGNVQVRAQAREGNAAQVLIDAAAGADLLVVGSRGHGGFTEALLGSVSQHCVHHAQCPVVIFRASNGRLG